MLSYKLIIRSQLIIYIFTILLTLIIINWRIKDHQLNHFPYQHIAKTPRISSVNYEQQNLFDYIGKYSFSMKGEKRSVLKYIIATPELNNTDKNLMLSILVNCSPFIIKKVIPKYKISPYLTQNISVNKKVDAHYQRKISINKNLFIILLFSLLLILVALSLTCKKLDNFFTFNTPSELLSFWSRKDGLPIRISTDRKKQKKQQNQEQKYYLIFQQLEETLESKQLFLDSKLSQQDIIKYLGTNRNYLYQALKLYTNTNFKGFINQFRIRHAKRLIENRQTAKEKYELSDIYVDCGFSTNESFYRTFKSITGTTPGKYEKDFSEKITGTETNGQSGKRRWLPIRKTKEKMLQQ